MISSVVVGYRVRPSPWSSTSLVEGDVPVIEAVFEQLGQDQPENVQYKVAHLDDGVCFVHVWAADTACGSNPLPEMAAFRQLARGATAPVATAPVAADFVGPDCPVSRISDGPVEGRSRLRYRVGRLRPAGTREYSPYPSAVISLTLGREGSPKLFDGADGLAPGDLPETSDGRRRSPPGWRSWTSFQLSAPRLKVEADAAPHQEASPTISSSSCRSWHTCSPGHCLRQRFP